jgi:hypothetical protein
MLLKFEFYLLQKLPVLRHQSTFNNSSAKRERTHHEFPPATQPEALHNERALTSTHTSASTNTKSQPQNPSPRFWNLPSSRALQVNHQSPTWHKSKHTQYPVSRAALPPSFRAPAVPVVRGRDPQPNSSSSTFVDVVACALFAPPESLPAHDPPPLCKTALSVARWVAVLWGSARDSLSCLKRLPRSACSFSNRKLCSCPFFPASTGLKNLPRHVCMMVTVQRRGAKTRPRPSSPPAQRHRGSCTDPSPLHEFGGLHRSALFWTGPPAPLGSALMTAEHGWSTR